MRTATCPRCGSVDVFSSRARNGLESALRALGLPARRCSACGWRGLRLRLLSPVAQRSRSHSSEPSAAEAAPASTPLGVAAAPAAWAGLASGVARAEERRGNGERGPTGDHPQHRSHHHHRHGQHDHRHHRVKTKRRGALRALGLALVLGLATGAVAQRCGEGQVVSAAAE